MHLRSNEKPFRYLRPAIACNGKYLPTSYWQETVSLDPGPPLTTSIDCDIAVVGGGFTGLSTAHELKRRDPSLEVVLLERTSVGHGASGRNGGFAMPLIGWDLVDAVHKLGKEVASDAYRLMYDAVAHLKDFVRESHLDCDLEETGYLLLATCRSKERRMKRELALAHEFGFKHEWIDKAALYHYIRSDSFLAGLYDPKPAIINPAKLAVSWKRLITALGVKVYEQTPLVELVDGEPAALRTPRGTVRAKKVVLGLNGYGASLGFMPARILPVHTFIVLTEPISDIELEKLGWAGRRVSLETARNFIHYFRLTADNRILFGGEDAALYFGGSYRDGDERQFARLEARFREYFPSLKHRKITHRWGGVLGVTLDMFPTFGVGGKGNNIFHAAGYSGHGVALSNFAGKVLAPLILQPCDEIPRHKQTPPFFLHRKPFPVPPEPTRYLGLQAYRALLRLGDYWHGA